MKHLQLLMASTMALIAQGMPTQTDNQDIPKETPTPEVELTVEEVPEVVDETVSPQDNGLEEGVQADAPSKFWSSPIPLDGPWQRFTFGPDGSTASPSFTTNYADDEIFQITDAYCRGDVFKVIVDGIDFEITPDVPADCVSGVVDPQTAFEDPTYSSGAYRLPAGPHEITIVMDKSPWGSGAAFVRGVSLPDECTIDGSDYIVLTNLDSHANAQAQCDARDSEFVNVTNDNIQEVSEVVFKCFGPYSRAWIKSWYGNDYGTCLAIHLGPVLPGASVNVPASCEEPLPIVCKPYQG